MLILTKHEMDCSVKEDNHWNPSRKTTFLQKRIVQARLKYVNDDLAHLWLR